MTREEATKHLKMLLENRCWHCRYERAWNKGCDEKCVFKQAVNEAIEALLAEIDRPMGEWINKGMYAECSICGAHSGIQFDGVEPVPLKTKFCHNCGAEMKIPLYMYASWNRNEE